MNPQADEVPDGKVGYKCRFCPERDPVFIKPGTGYSNLLPHIHKVHPQYREEMNLGHIDRCLVSENARPDKPETIASWLSWVVEDLEPFSFLERPTVRKYAKMDSISEDTLKEYLSLTYMEVVAGIADFLPDTFGLVLDGWRHLNNAVEFVGVFAAVPDLKKMILLGLVPIVLDEEYDDGVPFNPSTVLLGHEAYLNILYTILDAYNKTGESVAFPCR
ncbi:hypothetical protein GEMRC1_002334 [Eukaryota sp. GEM-RC1]